MTKPSVYTSVRPLHIAAKILGFLVFTIDEENFKPKFTLADLFFLASGIGLNFLMNYIYWTTIFDFIFERSTIMNISIPFITLCQNIIVGIILFAGFFRIREVCEIFRKFSEIDEEFERSFMVKFDYREQGKKTKRVTVTMFALITVIIVIRYSSNLIYMDSSSVKTNIYYFVCFCGSTVLLLSFKFAALGVKMRFEGVNRCLR
jgi:hypothetical protein